MSYLEGLMGKNEELILIQRQHWITIIGSVLKNLGWMLLLCGGGILALKMFSALNPGQGVALAVVGGLGLYPMIRLLLDWLHWLSDVYAVTNRRIVQISGIFNKHTIDSSLDKINDLVLNQTIVGRVLGYGDLEIMTGSEVGVNLLRRIPNPVRFKTEMLNQKELVADANRSKSQSSSAAPEGEIRELIEELAGLRTKGVLTEEEFQEKKAKLLAQI